MKRKPKKSTSKLIVSELPALRAPNAVQAVKIQMSTYLPEYAEQ